MFKEGILTQYIQFTINKRFLENPDVHLADVADIRVTNLVGMLSRMLADNLNKEENVDNFILYLRNNNHSEDYILKARLALETILILDKNLYKAGSVK